MPGAGARRRVAPMQVDGGRTVDAPIRPKRSSARGTTSNDQERQGLRPLPDVASIVDRRSEPDRRSSLDRRSPSRRRSSSDRASTPLRRSLPERLPAFSRLS